MLGASSEVCHGHPVSSSGGGSGSGGASGNGPRDEGGKGVSGGAGKGKKPIRVVPPDPRPHIPVGVDLERMTDQAIAALSTDERTYHRAGSLVGIVTIPEGPARLVRGVKRAPGSMTIRSLESGTVRERMSSVARWTRYDGRKDDHVGTLPPEACVSAVMGRGEWGGVRTLVSVATAPQLRPDGTILQTPGYDAQTGILYWPGDNHFPTVAEHPTIDDARGALEALREVVCDFPFARPEHQSAWLAGLLTMLARPAIDGPVPLFAVDATTAGTGKSRLVDAAARIAYGHDIARTSAPDEDEEMRKRITSIVLEGDPSVCVDNVRRAVDLPSLEAALTSMSWKDRLLGANRNVMAPHRTVWWLTANNVELRGDLGRRTLHVRLESQLEKPEERPESDFRHAHLLRWVEDERRRLVACALTLLRAFVVAGSPASGITPWGSFEAWSCLVPAALVWAGAESPMLSRATQDESVDEGRRILAVLHDGIARLSMTPITVRDMLSALYPPSGPGEPPPDSTFADLRDVLEGSTRTLSGRTPDALRVGKLLQKSRGRVLAGRKLVNGEQRRHVATWIVKPIDK
jgi:hypothetical protein